MLAVEPTVTDPGARVFRGNSYSVPPPDAAQDVHARKPLDTPGNWRTTGRSAAYYRALWMARAVVTIHL
jgi:hypothetical protein